MSSLSMVEATLPPGFRFHPRDDELVCDYLMKKWNGCESSLLTEVDLNKCEPWDIPARVGGKEWYFYSQRDRKYATGLRTNRATASGYWKATGKDRAVVRRGSLVGMRKTLVFYEGRAPKGTKTDWVMHEFRIEGPFGPPKLTSSSKEDWVLCKVFFKNKDGCSKSENKLNDDIDNDNDNESGSSSLPPLMDSFITFDQTHHHHHPLSSPNNNNNALNYQQVPCFSIISPNLSNPPNIITTQNNNNYHLDPNIATKHDHHTLSGSSSIHHHDDHDDGGGLATSNLSSIACDKKVLQAVLTHLTNMDTSSSPKPTNNGSPSSLGEPPTSQTYLSQLGLHHHPTMWNPF